MADARKHLKIVLPENYALLLGMAKEKAEDAAMIKMSDTQYASRLLLWALDQQCETRARISIRQIEETDDVLIDVHGAPGSVAHERALEMLRRYSKL